MVARLDAPPLTTSQIEYVVDQAEAMDPGLRPLFVQIAAMDRLDKSQVRTSLDDALKRIVDRKNAWLQARVASSSEMMLAYNLRLLATSVGGLTVGDYESLHPLPESLNNLLPGVFQCLGPSVTVDDLIDGVRPDIVGELFVLDRLGAEPTVALAATRLLRYAAMRLPDGYRGFVERVVTDHADHPRLFDLLQASGDGERDVSDLELGVAVMQLVGRSNHPLVQWIFDRLHVVIKKGRIDDKSRLSATARFKFANLVREEGDTQRAYDLYTEALVNCDPAWSEYNSILNNRGITLNELGRDNEAAADYSAVIETCSASAETRACSLNNRADIHDQQGELDEAIADRTAVLALPGTSYDRRFIALGRRARTLRKQGRYGAAYEDIARILDTDDIVVEQKMQARLLRAEWAREDGDETQAQTDFNEIAASYRNFPHVERKIQELGILPIEPTDNSLSP